MTEFGFTMDSIGRAFCKEHHREICHDCQMAFDISNRVLEERNGLTRKATEVEAAAQDYALGEVLESLKRMDLRFLPGGAVASFDEASKRAKAAKDELCRLAKEGNNVASQKRAAQELENNLMNQRALMQARSRYPILEAESREDYKKRIYWSVASPPPIDSSRADLYTCAYCRKISTGKLKCCDRCKKSSYCSTACQQTSWKMHKKDCIAADKGALSLPLTWAQLEAHGGRPVEGETLELRAILDVTSTMRQVFICKDRIGDVMQVAAYTTSRSLHPDLKQGSIIKWKNPRFHYFKDPSCGARIEEEDLVNITVTNA